MQKAEKGLQMNNLCGSHLAHSACKFKGEITDERIHLCSAVQKDYEVCEYADKGGLLHINENINIFLIRGGSQDG